MRFYLYASMVMCVVDFIKSYRVNKYRKHVDSQLEMIRATMNIFLPIYRLLVLISNLSIIFKSKEYVKLIAMMEDINLLGEEE
mgnify:FL=1